MMLKRFDPFRFYLFWQVYWFVRDNQNSIYREDTETSIFELYFWRKFILYPKQLIHNELF